MMTNIGKAKAEIILELVLSLNRGDSGYVDQRVRYAINQYDKLVEQGIIKEEEHCDENKLTPVPVDTLPVPDAEGIVMYKKY